MFAPLLEKVVRHEDLSEAEAAGAMREVMAPMGLPGARRGMKKLNDAATKMTRKNMPMRRTK